MNPPHACACGRRLDLAEVLDAARGWDPALRILVGQCPHCGTAFEVEPRAGMLRFGHTYFAGSMHFEPTSDVVAPGLALTTSEEETLCATDGGRRWTFEPPASGAEWMFVFPGAFAVGKAIAELGLEALGARVDELQRPRFEPIAFTPESRLRAGDRLRVIGRHAALRRAWARLHEGR